jgi:hypothetical protein
VDDVTGELTGEACNFLDGEVGPNCAAGSICEQSGQFRVVLTPSPRDGWPSYKLNASNPGQYFYNAIVTGDPGETVPVTVNLAYPFVTQGATPVHVYDAEALSFDPDGCFVPDEATQSIQDHQVAIEDYIGGTMDAALSCDQVGCGFDGEGSCTFEVAVEIPASGQAYLNVHMDYGLKGASVDANDGTLVNANETVCDEAGDRYDLGALDPNFGGWDALENVDTDDPVFGELAISNCKSYDFSHDDGTDVFEDQVQSLNIFKRIKGVYGPVFESDTESGVSAAWIEVYRVTTGELVASGVSDEDGYYAIPYKHIGKRAQYDVTLNGGEITQRVQLKSNGWAEVSFDTSTGTSIGFFTSSGGDGGGRGGPGSCTATETPEVSCNDGVDNDCDGDTDMVDVDCNGGFCTDAQLGESCTDDADCCSNKCRGRNGAKVCK